jgi:hypothetical protein
MSQAKRLEFPDPVLTKGKSGKLEVRSLDSRGSYVMCKYLDSKTMKLADKKRKLMLKGEDGKLLEYFIIPLRDPKRALLVSAEPDEKERLIWNDNLEKAEEIWRE